MFKQQLLKLTYNLQKIIISLGTVALALTSCGKVIQRQVNTIPATVIEVKYHNSYTTPYYNPSIKSWSYIYHPEDYSTFIKCNNTIYNLDSKEAYNLCKDKIKQEILVDYVMLYYENGTIETYVEVGGFR